jgi:hypothetical protein
MSDDSNRPTNTFWVSLWLFFIAMSLGDIVHVLRQILEKMK